MDFNTFLDFLDEIRGFFIFLYTQFVGSETQDPYSESYIWMANQFGHFFIGFGGLFILTWLVSFIRRKPAPSYGFGATLADPTGRRPTLSRKMIWTLALLWLTVWMTKEWLFDFYLMSQETSRLVSPYKADLLYDTATDSFFYLAGIAVALAHFGMLRISPLPVLIYVTLAAFGLAIYWLPIREKIETTGTPYFIRLNGPDLGIDINFDAPGADDFLSKLTRQDAARSGVRPVMGDEPYPLEYMMETPLGAKQQIIAVASSKVVNRLGMALTNERVVRQKPAMPCNSRYITFRDLMESRISNEGTAAEPKWTIASLEPQPPASGEGGAILNGFPDPRCPLEQTEFLVVDQVPSVEIAATLVTGLVAFPDTGWKQMQERREPFVPEGFPPTARQLMNSLAQIVEAQGERNMEIFLRALDGRIVIWLLDNERIAGDWQRLLLRYYRPDDIRIMDPSAP